MANTAVITGRITADPELKRTQQGTSVVSFSVAVPKRFKPKDGNGPDVDFIDVTAWRSCAEFVAKYFKKGQRIEVEGRIETRIWEDKNGSKRKSTEIVAENVGFGESKNHSDPGNGESKTPVSRDTSTPPTASWPSAENFIIADDEGDLPF